MICTGFSTPQLQAICNEIEELLYREMKRSPEHREGNARRNGRCWILAALSCMSLASKRGVITTWNGCGARLPRWCLRMSRILQRGIRLRMRTIFSLKSAALDRILLSEQNFFPCKTEGGRLPS